MKVLLVSPIGSVGDVYPFLDLGIALKARGHTVTLMASGYFRARATQAGLAFAQMGDPETLLVNLGGTNWARRVASRNVRASTVNTALPLILHEAYRLIAEYYDPGRTVVVAQLFTLGASVAHDKFGVPVAYVGVAPAYFESLTYFEWIGPMIARLAELIWHTRGIVNELRSQVGLAVWSLSDWVKWLHSPGPILGLFPDWFAPPTARWVRKVLFTEFSLYDDVGYWTPPAELVRFLNGGDPPIVFTKPSWLRFQTRFVTEASAVCHRLGRRGVFIGVEERERAKESSAAFGVFGYVPLSWLLPRSAALIHHGGIGTSAHALAAGKPQLVRPLDGVQVFDSRRLSQLGVAFRHVPWFPRQAALTSAMENLLESSELASQCHLIAERMREHQGMRKTCEVIEQMVL
jgi:rhamnosyltransferase subunit B